jgi:hypothetical protein
LELLVEHGILVRVDEEVDGQKVDRYVLTKKGADARPILLALNDWGNKYAAPNGAPRELFHEECGHVVSPKLVCDHCSGELKASNTVMRPGPGANKHQQSIGDVRPARSGDAA